MRKQWLLLLAICLQASDLRISEVMSNPQGSEYENEFIEIFNAGIGVIHINGWTLTDGSGIDTVDIWYGQDSIHPGKNALILDPGYDFSGGIYHGLIPDSIPIYTISTDASFGSGGLANSGEMVMLSAPDSSEFTWMSWTEPSENGHSWERWDPSDPDSLAQWSPSIHINGTPGYRNSISPAEHNLSLTNLDILIAETGIPLELSARIVNSGLNSVHFFQIEVHESLDQDSLPDADEWRKTYSFPHELPPESIFDATLTLPDLRPGIQRYVALLLFDLDEAPEDNLGEIQVAGAHPPESVTINEIMSSPTTEQEGEWIEIWNHSPEPLSLNGWALSDANETRHAITQNEILMAPDSFLLLCADPGVVEVFELEDDQVLSPGSWPTLNGSSDSVRIFDATGQCIDRVFYRGSWGEVGKSLERRHPLLAPTEAHNWAVSLHPDGATPGQINSQQLAPYALDILSITIQSEEIVGPADVPCIIHFSNQGLEPIQGLHFETNTATVWDGYLNSFESDTIRLILSDVASGMSDRSISIFYEDTVLVDTLIQITLGFPQGLLELNEIHYLPITGESEFLEFYHTGSIPIDMKGWSMSDRSGARGTITSSGLLDSGAYLVLCQDLFTMDDLIPQEATGLGLSSWPSLNNNSDSLFLYDPSGQLHLAHGYTSQQGGDLGVSLERKALWSSSQNIENWTSSTHPDGITPGMENSVALPPMNVAVQSISVVDSLPLQSASFLVSVNIENKGQESVDHLDLHLRLQKMGAELEVYDMSVFELPPNVVEAINFDVSTNQCGWIHILTQIALPGDMVQNDNAIDTLIYVGCNHSPLIISEIYPLPFSSEGEWVELYNRGTDTIDLNGWLLKDRSEQSYIFSGFTNHLPGMSYGVLANDDDSPPLVGPNTPLWVQDMPSLNNTSDELKLMDPLGRLADEMSYDESIIHSGRSTERISLANPGHSLQNWGICVDERGSTPGEENSLNLIQLPQVPLIAIVPNPFSPNGDGKDDELHINFELPVEQASMVVWIFDMAGRQIATPERGRPVGHRGQILWNGRTSTGRFASTGIYLLKVMIEGQQGELWQDIMKVYLLR